MSDFKQHPTGETLEQTRHNYEVKARMEESDDASYAGVMIKPSQKGINAATNQRKNNRSINDILLLNDTLASFENMMVKKYGEDFDLHLAAEFLDDETYKHIASIQDIEQRREAVAQAIQDGIENGTIDPQAVDYFNPDFGQWAEKRIEHSSEIALKREQELKQEADNNTGLTQDNNFEQDAMAVFGSPSPSS